VSVGTSDRPPVRARSGRRPLPPLIFLLVLAVAALGVWWYVLHRGDAAQQARDAACASAADAPPSLVPSTLSVRVLNATDQQGLAQTVAKDLQSRGFTVSEFGNDSSGRTIAGVGEIRHGARGRQSAAYLRVYLPGASDYLDTRATATVDLVIGPDFKQLATPDQVAAALKPGAKAADATC
jgi:hypothetical protein